MIYELPVEEYLFIINSNKCFLLIHKLNIDEVKNMNLIGLLFLRNFYSIFDYDR